MYDRLVYYMDLVSSTCSRSLRRLSWHSRYYILPAYQRLFADDDQWHRRRWQLSSALTQPTRRQLAAGAVLAVLATAGGAWGVHSLQQAGRQTPAAEAVPPITALAPSPPPVQPPAPAAAPAAATPVVTPPATKPFLFGLGAQADGAMGQRLYRDAPVNLLTSWFNGPDDLSFMRGWQSTTVPRAYAEGKSLHLVIWTGDKEQPLDTVYGPACGRAYPLSAGFEADMRQLAQIFKGSGPLYVSMFTEFQTYPCRDNTWRGSENYYRALKDRYRLAQSIFKQHAPNSQVSLTWGGWQAAWDDRGNGGGKSLLPHFADVLKTSDFQSFQAMDSRDNLQHILDMTHLLHSYGNGRVMVAHYKPDNASQATWQRDLERIFTPATMARLQNDGLFAFSFMDELNLNASEAAYQQARQIIRAYAR